MSGGARGNEAHHPELRERERRVAHYVIAHVRCAVVGVTLGGRGALIYCEGEFIESTAFAVPGGCRDTTGAGDAFHGGFIYGMLCGEDLEACMKLGNAVAALKCRTLGGRTALPTAVELKDFCQNRLR